MAIFNSYVKLPEGIYCIPCIPLCLLCSISYSVYIMSYVWIQEMPFLAISCVPFCVPQHEAHNVSLRADAQRELQSVMQTVSGNLNSKDKGKALKASVVTGCFVVFNWMKHDVYIKLIAYDAAYADSWDMRIKRCEMW